MSDYLVGKKGSSNKDRFMVGWNESKQNANAYRVGNAKSGPSAASKSVGGDQDSVVGSKSAFNYKENDYKDEGANSDNMNFGGEVSNGIKSLGATAPGGDVLLDYAEKGSWDMKKDAMARRRANLEASRGSAGNQYDSPTVDLVKAKK